VHDEFTHQLCAKWEAIAEQAESEQTRVCLLRTGVVLAKQGGALNKMAMPFKLGFGGPIGDGEQMMSWIHIDDMVDLIIYLLEQD
ncbi:NAD-dependent epimerase/dehydratase family protein, partial [Streptococcus pyogenes]